MKRHANCSFLDTNETAALNEQLDTKIEVFTLKFPSRKERNINGHFYYLVKSKY